jgi:hypothetical protein
MMRIFGWMLLGCLVLIILAGFTQAAEEEKALPAIEIERSTHDFGQVSQGEVVKHDFRVFNRGTAPLEIKSVKPG